MVDWVFLILLLWLIASIKITSPLKNVIIEQAIEALIPDMHSIKASVHLHRHSATKPKEAAKQVHVFLHPSSMLWI